MKYNCECTATVIVVLGLLACDQQCDQTTGNKMSSHCGILKYFK